MEENNGMNPVAAEAAEAPETAVPEASDAAREGGSVSNETGGASVERNADDGEGPLLPQDWTPEEDILSGPSLKDLFPAEPDAGQGETDRNAPETPTEKESASNTAPARETPGEAPDGGEKPDYKAMYEALVQKEKDAEDKETFRRVYHEEMDAGMSERWARTAAANAVGGRTFPLTDEPGGSGGQPDSPDAAASAVKQLSALYPGVKEIPAEVGQMVRDGADLVSAYSAYRTREDAKAMQALTAENQRLRKALGNAAKAPVRGVSGGGRNQEETDDFLRGFNMGWN